MKTGTKKKHSVSDRYLEKLWREAVLKEHGYRCFFCHYSEVVGPLECHHIVRRRKRLLCWDYRNGIPVHKYHLIDGHLTCHQFAHTKEGERKIAAWHKYYDYLCEREKLNKKDVLLEHGMTENEFRLIMLTELKMKISE